MIDINKHKYFLVQILKDIYSDIELANYLGFKGGTCISMIESLSDRSMLQGMGELMNDEMKKFVRKNLRTDTIGLLKFYKEFPLLV